MNELKKGCTLQHGKYTIVKMLGQGSFGITYQATTKITMIGNLGRLDSTAIVAIKEFFMSDMNSRSHDGSIEGSSSSLFSKYRASFKKEAINLSHLDHPNIVKVLDVFDEKNTTYYVMQYINGICLDDYIAQKKGLPESVAMPILRDICNAVQYIHSKNMLHLDIKPKNVMLDADGKAYLIDFGLSKQYTDSGVPESSTTLGLGTPGYAPIEQANYKQDGTFPATLDIYALGATLFKIFAGCTPPLASEILCDGFPEEVLINKNVNSAIVYVVKKAMNPMKRERYQTVEEFLNSFEEEATIIGVEVAEGKREGKEKNVDSRLFEISPFTKKVEISFLPSFPSAGMYEATIKKDEIQIRSGLKKSRWDLSRKAFSKFLSSLTALDLKVRIQENPEYLEASENAPKLTITLYDDNNSIYAKYWIGGWSNQFGNIIGETLAINEQLEVIIPHLNEFLNSPIEEEEEKKDKVSPKEKIKKFLQVRSNTSKVRIEYWPYSLFPPRYTGAFVTTVTSYEVNPNVTQESTREMIPMTQEKYKNFINALQALKLEIREDPVEHFNPGSFSPAKLKITLYDNAGIIYKDLWIDGMSGGNIVGNVDVIEKQIIQIVPGLSQYLNGPFYEVPDLIKEKETQRKTTRDEWTEFKDVEEETIIDKDIINKPKVTIYPDSDKIDFFFRGSSVPPPYHRSYETHITEHSISLRITCYDDVLYEGNFPCNKSCFSKLIETLQNLDIHKIPEFDKGGDGGETLTLILRRNGADYYSGYTYGSKYKIFGGTTDADLYLVKSEIEKCIPNFQALLAKGKDEEPREYEFDDEEPSFFEKYWKHGLAAVVVLLCIYYCYNWNSSSSTSADDVEFDTDTLLVDSVAEDTIMVDTIAW